MPPAVAVFAGSVLAALIGVLAALVFRNDFGYGPVAWALTATVVALMSASLAILHGKVVHPRHPEWEVAFRLDLFLLTMSLPAAFVAYAGAGVLLTLLALNAIALALFPSTPAVARWAWRALVAAIRPTQGKRLAPSIPRTD